VRLLTHQPRKKALVNCTYVTVVLETSRVLRLFMRRSGSVLADLVSNVEWDNGSSDKLFNATVEAVQHDLLLPNSIIEGVNNGSTTSLVLLQCIEGCNSTFIPEEEVTGLYDIGHL
jgi:hypothetical protein